MLNFSGNVSVFIPNLTTEPPWAGIKRLNKKCDRNPLAPPEDVLFSSRHQLLLGRAVSNRAASTHLSALFIGDQLSEWIKRPNRIDLVDSKDDRDPNALANPGSKFLSLFTCLRDFLSTNRLNKEGDSRS